MAYISKFTGAQIDALLDASEKMQTSKEDVANKTIIIDAASTNKEYPSARAVLGFVENEISFKEDKVNKTQVINSASTEVEYPSAKAVYDLTETKESIKNKATFLDEAEKQSHTRYPSAKAVMLYVENEMSFKEDVANKTIFLDDASDDRQYPTAKAVYDHVDYATKGKEDVANKVTSINADADDSHYPSAKAVRDLTNNIWEVIGAVTEDKFWYGIEKDTTVSSPTCTRIGNMGFHRTLPVHSLMRGCLLADDGTVNKYLDPDDWTNEVLDGSQGQVMVEIPRHFRKCEADGNIIRVKLSLLPLEGFHEVPKMYVSAYEAALDRSTNKLCSVVNEGADYRGGNNNANYDGTYRSFLGRPVTSISRTAFRTAARKRKSGSSEWNCYPYQVHKALFWLFTVEYATLNSQAAFNAELTSEGYRQGGLGAGVSDWSSSDWSTFNGYYPFVPCGHTDTLGNATGVVAYTALNADGSELKTSNVPRYRGVENPFGHIWKWSDGINVRISPTEANGGDNLSKVFVCEDPSKLNDTNYNGYKHVGNEARTEGYVKEIIFGEEGEIMPSLVGGGSTQFFCDNHYTHIPTTESLRGVLFGGNAFGGASDGLAFARTSIAPSYSNANVGSRLCFIPAKIINI